MSKKLIPLNLVPVSDRIIIRRLDNEAVSKGGIVLPDSAQQKQAKGVVLAVGPGAVRDDGTYAPMGVQSGDVVLFEKYSANGIELDGYGDDEILVIKMADVMAIEVCPGRDS